MRSFFIPMPEQSKKPKYTLSNIIVQSLGLVGKGAIGEDFFLIKSIEGNNNPMENEQDEITQDEVGKSLLQSIGLAKVESWVKEAVQKAATPKKKANPFASDEAEEEEEDEDEMAMAENKKKSNKVKKNMELTKDEIMKSDAFKSALDEVIKQQTTLLNNSLETQKVELQKQFDADKAELEKATTLAKSEAENAKVEAAKFSDLAKAENDKRVLADYVVKAKENYTALPLKASELGQLFFDISKWDDEIKKSNEAATLHLPLIQDVLKAANQALLQSGLFNEHGSSLIPEEGDIVAKAQVLIDTGKAKTMKEAMLLLPKTEQATHVSKAQRKQ